MSCALQTESVEILLAFNKASGPRRSPASTETGQRSRV